MNNENPFEAIATNNPTEKDGNENEKSEKDLHHSMSNSTKAEGNLFEVGTSESFQEEAKKEDGELYERLDEDDSFWVIQRVVWGIVKMAVILGVIFFIIWMIWNPSENPLDSRPRAQKSEQKKADNSVKIDKKKPKTRNIYNSLSKEDPIISIVRQHENAEKTLANFRRNSLEDGIFWLKKMRTFFQVPPQNLISEKLPRLRAENFRQVLAKIDFLIADSSRIRLRLNRERLEFLSIGEKINQNSINAEKLFLNAVSATRPEIISSSLEQKIDSAKRFSELQHRAEARRIILEKMENYDRAIRNLREIMIANKDAIIKDIRVVQFPVDPWGRVLSPTEWRSGNFSNLD